ncbi:PREDICTED: GDNF family receptor alpha-2-like [Cyprinodon variegatus]|uniref:GDNF family receptor alpha-2-like n=1 Tax=Cyprinodon variegatus TaxID=28743 RepID=UPI0007429B1C|nr:PREDICTED: GDNF family receptor alpha-2-like [Cyprinodon variegatus]
MGNSQLLQSETHSSNPTGLVQQRYTACYPGPSHHTQGSNTDGQPSRLAAGERSQPNRSQPPENQSESALRQFFERVSSELSYPLLFCSCLDQACAERRRRTIVPSCSHQERHKPSCLELRHTCRSDALCRSRLADFHMNCQMTSQTVTSCPYDNYIGCLMSYIGLIGSDVTPNYSDNSPTNITISLWCTCRGTGHQEPDCEAFHRDFTHNTCLSSDVTPNYSDNSPTNITISLWCTCRGTGHQEPDCEAFHRDFTHNTCLKNAIVSFGYGSEGAAPPVTEPPFSLLPPAQPPIISKLGPSLHGKAIKPMDTACMFSTCADLQDGGPKCMPSDDYECEETLLAQGSIESLDSVGPTSSSRESAPLLHHISVIACVSSLPALLYFLF